MLQRPAQRDDAGLTLIEVMVALLVFAIIATGIVASMGTITRMTVDDRARVTAENLAAQEVDLVRAISDPFTIVNKTTATPVDGRTYTIKRSVSWVSSTGADAACNSGVNVSYLRLNVRVTWPGMLTTAGPVQDDTLIAPSGRISDSSSGSISVLVVGAGNTPEAGVSVTVTPVSGDATAKALNTQPKATNSDGCTYANEVAPGNYTVAISKSGYLTANQASSWSGTVQVTAGSTATTSNQPLYDQAASVTTNYVASPVTTTSAFQLPTNMETTWVNSSGTWATTPATQGASVSRFPATDGYGVIAGQSPSSSPTCPATDPQAWSAGTSNGKKLANGSRATVSTSPGGSSTVNVPVGVAQVKAPAGYYLAATQATPASGTPSCAITGSVYLFPSLTNGSYQSVALPYGSWRFVYGTSTSNYYVVPATNIQVQTNAAGGGVAADGTTTLDPRPLAP